MDSIRENEYKIYREGESYRVAPWNYRLNILTMFNIVGGVILTFYQRLKWSY